MVDIVYRSGATGATGVKNAPLTHIELDQNFRNINDYKVEKDAIGAIIPGSTGATGIAGHFRLNTSTNKPEMYGSSGWIVAIGATGYTGSTGATGITGASGVQGASGATGIIGASGSQGASGASGTGLTISGSTGVSPPTGATGIGTGVITTDTGHLWIYNGASWVDAGNITGPTGATGSQGASGVGATGVTGASGAASTVAGATGPTGATGPQGASGANGTNGASGISGASGYVGSDGATGPAGATGASTTATVTDDTTTNASYYPMMSDVTSGTPNASYVSSVGFYFNPATGTLNSTIFNSLSDLNKKENIWNITNALDIVNGINGVKFTWKQTGLQSAGLIAQEVEAWLPELVTTEEGVKTLNYNGVIGVLVEAIKKLDARVKELENK